MPGSNLTLGCTTTRSRELFRYEGVGIPPQRWLDPAGDWLVEVVKILEKR